MFCTWHGGRFYPRKNFTKKNRASFCPTSALLRFNRTITSLKKKSVKQKNFRITIALYSINSAGQISA
jgi:hypothetical protein